MDFALLEFSGWTGENVRSQGVSKLYFGRPEGPVDFFNRKSWGNYWKIENQFIV
jgi:hypothetical protein